MNGYDVVVGTANVPLMFLMVSSTDHVTGLPGIAASIAVQLVKNGVGPAPPAAAVIDMGHGMYGLTANATDTNSVGILWLHAEGPGADPADVLFNVVNYNPYSNLNLGLQCLPVANPGKLGGLPMCNDNANGVQHSVGTGPGQLSTAAGKVQATLGPGDYAGDTPQTGDSFARIGAAGAGLTALAPAGTALSSATWTPTRAANLDRLDAAVSSRSTYAGTDTPGTTTLVGLLTPTRATNLDRLDATVSSRSTYAGGDTPGTTSALAILTGVVASADHTQFTAHALALAPTGSGGGGTDPWATALPGGYAAGTAGAILGGRLDVAVSTRSTYAGGDTAGTTTLLGLLTPARAGNLDRLDAAVSTRSTYAGTDTAGTTTLVARLTAVRAANLDNLDAAISTRSTYAGGPVASVTAPVSVGGGTVDAIAGPVTVAGGTVTTVTNPVTVGTIADKAGYSLAATGLDAISTAAPAGVASTFREMMVAIFRRFYRRSTKSVQTGQIVTYADDGTTVLTTQTFSDDGSGNEALGSAT